MVIRVAVEQLSVANRTQRVFTGSQMPDRVPVHAWLGLQFIRKLIPRQLKMRDLFQRWIDDPLGTLIKYQEDVGLDPIMTTYSQHIGEHEIWPRMLFDFADSAFDGWEEQITETDRTASSRTIQHRIHTPAGIGQYTYHIEDYCAWILEHLIKSEADLELLQFRPDPEFMDVSVLKSMVEKVGDRAWWLHHPPGPWDEAVELRGFDALMHDITERQAFVHRLMRLVTDRLIKLYRRLGETGIDAISMNETWVGVGISRDIYRQFIYPYEVQCVQAAHDAGLLVSYHNCGRGAEFLDDMLATGADALETITSVRNRGDFDLAAVKRHVGDSICLFGGFNERLLTTDNPGQVRDEVRRCLNAAAEGGRYILRPSGQIFHADVRNIEVMCQTAHDYGRYG
jgi:uroporphyrinogen-III decarboxylase